MIDLKEIQQTSVEEHEKIQKKKKERIAKFTKKFISKVEKDIERRAKAGSFYLAVRINKFGLCAYLNDEEFISHFKKLGFLVDDKKYHYASCDGRYWYDIISWEVKNDTDRKR